MENEPTWATWVTRLGVGNAEPRSPSSVGSKVSWCPVVPSFSPGDPSQVAFLSCLSEFSFVWLSLALFPEFMMCLVRRSGEKQIFAVLSGLWKT